MSSAGGHALVVVAKRPRPGGPPSSRVMSRAGEDRIDKSTVGDELVDERNDPLREVGSVPRRGRVRRVARSSRGSGGRPASCRERYLSPYSTDGHFLGRSGGTPHRRRRAERLHEVHLVDRLASPSSWLAAECFVRVSLRSGGRPSEIAVAVQPPCPTLRISCSIRAALGRGEELLSLLKGGLRAPDP